VLISGCLQCDRLRDHIGSLLEVLAGVARVFVIGVAEIDDRQILNSETGGIDVEDVSIVLRALHKPAIVREHHGAAIVGEAQERNVVLGDSPAA
jgi:hypothetical protein